MVVSQIQRLLENARQRNSEQWLAQITLDSYQLKMKRIWNYLIHQNKLNHLFRLMKRSKLKSREERKKNNIWKVVNYHKIMTLYLNLKKTSCIKKSEIQSLIQLLSQFLKLKFKKLNKIRRGEVRNWLKIVMWQLLIWEMDVGITIISHHKSKLDSTDLLRRSLGILMTPVLIFGLVLVWFLRCWLETFCLSPRKGSIMQKMMIIWPRWLSF